MQHSRETKLLRLNIKLSYLYHIAFKTGSKAVDVEKAAHGKALQEKE